MLDAKTLLYVGNAYIKKQLITSTYIFSFC